MTFVDYLSKIKESVLEYQFDADTIAMIPGIITSIGLVIYCNIK